MNCVCLPSSHWIATVKTMALNVIIHADHWSGCLDVGAISELEGCFVKCDVWYVFFSYITQWKATLWLAILDDSTKWIFCCDLCGVICYVFFNVHHHCCVQSYNSIYYHNSPQIEGNILHDEYLCRRFGPIWIGRPAKCSIILPKKYDHYHLQRVMTQHI